MSVPTNSPDLSRLHYSDTRGRGLLSEPLLSHWTKPLSIITERNSALPRRLGPREITKLWNRRQKLIGVRPLPLLLSPISVSARRQRKLYGTANTPRALPTLKEGTSLCLIPRGASDPRVKGGKRGFWEAKRFCTKWRIKRDRANDHLPFRLTASVDRACQTR